MKRMFLAIFVFFVLSSNSWGAVKNDNSTILKELQESNLRLTQRIVDLERTTDLNYKHYDAILENKRSNYTDNVATLSAMLFLGLGFIGLINFGLVKRALSGEHKENLLKLREELLLTVDEIKKELATTTQTLRENFNNSTEDLRREFPQQIISSVRDIEHKTEVRLNELEKDFELKISELEADRCEVLGRIYAKTGGFFSAALWFARAVKQYVENEVSDENWVKGRIRQIRMNLEKAEVKSIQSKYFFEIEKIISVIPDKEFKQEKDELNIAFEKKRAELPKTKESNDT